MDDIVKLTDAQVALMIAEKVTGTLNQGYKRERDVLSSAEVFLKWLEEKQVKNKD